MISDNELLLYYYRDGLDADERNRIATALGEQPELAARLHRLVARLDAAAAMPEVPVPEVVQRRWQAAVESAAVSDASNRGSMQTNRRNYWRLAAAACVAVLLIVSVKFSLRTPEQLAEHAAPVHVPTPTRSDDSPAYERGLRWHLASTQTQLEELDSISGAERRELIDTIITQNRLYAIAAERANEPQLARVLRAFTPLLERVAAEHDTASAGDVAQLNFELKAMQARLNAASADSSGASSVAL